MNGKIRLCTCFNTLPVRRFSLKTVFSEIYRNLPANKKLTKRQQPESLNYLNVKRKMRLLRVTKDYCYANISITEHFSEDVKLLVNVHTSYKNGKCDDR